MVDMHIIYSTRDPAGSLISKNLKEKDPDRFEEGRFLTKTDSSLLDSDELANSIKTDFLVFASKHKSESGKPSLTVHVPGNWASAEMGGKEGQISWSDPMKMKALAFGLSRIAHERGIEKETAVTMEVDHHGPLSHSPCAFVEVGSTMKEWEDERYSEAVAEAIYRIEDYLKEIEVKKVAVGVGGGHYCPAFNKGEIEGDVAFAHIVPNYAAPKLEYETFIQAFERTTEEVEEVLIDWKGLKQQERDKIIGYCGRYGAEWKRA